MEPLKLEGYRCVEIGGDNTAEAGQTRKLIKRSDPRVDNRIRQRLTCLVGLWVSIHALFDANNRHADEGQHDCGGQSTE